MNRCDLFRPSRRKAVGRLALFALPALLALPAAAQMPRNFPAQALRGELQVLQPPEVLLNGRPARLAPGARIRGERNLMLLSGALAGQARQTVNYTVDGQGLLMEVWLLSADERARRPWPITAEEARRLQFDPVAQTWSRP